MFPCELLIYRNMDSRQESGRTFPDLHVSQDRPSHFLSSVDRTTRDGRVHQAREGFGLAFWFGQWPGANCSESNLGLAEACILLKRL
jgi:hypothetical protein